MTQITLEMDDETMARIRNAAEKAGLSVSAWLLRLVQERTHVAWPQEVVALAGSWKDFDTNDTPAEIRASDVVRETL